MEVLSEIIECSVCLERMDTKSRVLPCQHTFCSDCLHRIAIQNKNELKCPECRYICTVPVRNLPTNILLIRLLEGMKTAGKPISSKREKLLEAGNPCAEAMYSYEPQEQGDLRFRRGDLVYLKKRLDENWFVGELNGKSGYLPATYVKVICPFPQSKPLPPSNTSSAQSTPVLSPQTKVMVRALYDFEMKDEEKEDCLKFRKDEMLELIRRVDDNWAEGRLAAVVGIFPLNYVQITELAKALLNSPAHTRVPSSSRLPSHTRTRNVSGPAFYSSPSSDQSEASRRGVTDQPSSRHNPGSQSNSYIPIPGSTCRQSHTSVFSSSAPSDSPVRSGFSTSASPADSGSNRGRTKSSDSNSGEQEESSPPPATTKISIHNIYRAMYNYKPQKDDELALSRGALYHVSDRCKDGWYRGRCLRLGTSGVFPGNYVQLIPPDSESDALLTMRRGRLEPPVEKQASSPPDSNSVDVNTTASNKSVKPESRRCYNAEVVENPDQKASKANSERPEETRKLWGLDVMGSPAPSAKLRSSVRRTTPTNNRDRRRSSSLSRLENPSTTVIRPHDLPPKPIRNRMAKPVESINKPVSRPIRMRYVCVMAYPAQSDLELDLKVGDVVVVLKKKSEGWYKGTNETSGKTGVFPACFVQSYSSSNNESRSS